MTKARFTSYEPVTYEPNEPFRLFPRQEPLRRVLLVDGNLAGPKHDPYRYIRALVSVGWEIEKAETEVLPRLAMQTFKKEIEAILIQLMGSPWAPHPQVQDVIAEYQHFVGSGKTPTQTRRVSLQIFHASRANRQLSCSCGRSRSGETRQARSSSLLDARLVAELHPHKLDQRVTVHAADRYRFGIAEG